MGLTSYPLKWRLFREFQAGESWAFVENRPSYHGVANMSQLCNSATFEPDLSFVVIKGRQSKLQKCMLVFNSSRYGDMWVKIEKIFIDN